MNELTRSIIRSYTSLPLWVQWWVGFLVLVNSGWVFLLDTPTGVATAIAAGFVVATNGPLTAYYRGMNRALSIPHLFAWIPLEIFLIDRLFLADTSIGTAEFAYGLTVIVTNGVSLAFDVLDSWRWLRGERETPGVTAA